MKFFRLIASNLAPLTLIAAIAAYFFPPLFVVFKPWLSWMFGATMFALGLVLKPEEMRDTLTRPKPIALGVLTQYSVMPLLAFAAAWFGDLPPALALGFIIVGCAPGAMASNVMVYLAGGAVAFSITLTTVATMLSPLLTPTLVKWLGGAFMPVAFWPLMKTILLTVLLPLIVGMLVGRQMERMRGAVWLSRARDVAPAVATLAIIIICGFVVAANQTRIAEVGPTVILLVVVVNALGYLAGWFLARLYGFDARHRLTLAVEIGMQNAGLGVVLALKHFEPQTALPGALFAVWCILTASGASAWLRRHPDYAFAR